MENIKKVLAEMSREELLETALVYIHPNGGGDPTPQQKCMAAHAGKCGVCDVSGGWTPCA